MGTTHKIKPGDNLSSIAKQYGTTVSALQSANGIKNPNLIIAGKTLNIPNSSVTQLIKDDVGGGASSNNGGGSASSNSTQGYTYTPFEYGAYTESAETLGAKDSLTNANNALTEHGDFNWVDQGKLDEYTSKYENRDKFSYDFNTDALYQQYKDKYINQAKMASADVMGQAAAMNGGYGSSYSQTLGNQAYQQSLGQLNDVIPELYQLAYDKYNQEGQDMLNTISLLRGERDFAYGKHNDEYTKLVNDRNYWSDTYNNLYNRDYSKYADDRNFAQTNHNTAESYKYQAHRDAVTDAQWQAEFDEGKRQFEANMSFAREQYEESKKASSGGSGGSGGNAALQHVASMSPAELVETMQSYSLEGDNTGLAAFLDDCEASGRLSPEQADEYYAKYVKEEEKPKDNSVVKSTLNSIVKAKTNRIDSIN